MFCFNIVKNVFAVNSTKECSGERQRLHYCDFMKKHETKLKVQSKQRNIFYAITVENFFGIIGFDANY